MQNRIISAISVLLYIISFIGFIENISKESKVKVKYFERHNININIIKIIILSILSSILLLGVQATTSAFIVLLDYLIIATIKLVQMNKKKKIATLWCFSIIVVMAFIIIANGLGYLKINSLFLSFMPEIDANGGGAQVIQQNDIIDSANLFGKVENIGEDIILTFNSEGEIYPLIVVLANYGWVVCAIMIAIILAFNAILIFDAIKIKDRYGKLLIIGIACLFIIRSLCCLLMNLNLGIKAKFDIPFISCNKSKLVIDIISLALIFSVYRRKDINVSSKKDNEEMDTSNFSNKEEARCNLKGYRRKKILTVVCAIIITILVLVNYFTLLNYFLIHTEVFVNINDIYIDCVSEEETNGTTKFLFNTCDLNNAFDYTFEEYEVLENMGIKTLHIKTVGRYQIGGAAGGWHLTEIDDTIEKIYLEDKYGNAREIWSKEKGLQMRDLTEAHVNE